MSETRSRTDRPATEFGSKSVVVTGGASGMGAATARRFAALGAKVFIVDRDAVGARRVTDEIGEATMIVGDVSQSTFCDHTIEQVIAAAGRIDVLVNCAGVILRADAMASSDDDWHNVMSVNVDGVFYMSRAVIPHMVREQSGVIVNFGSIWGEIGATGVVAYCASKGAVHQLTKAMALDHATDGIRINAVAPGEVDTPMLSSGRATPPTADELQRLADETIPMKRLANPDEIAGVVVFLASDDASYMTGAIVPVDAGFTAR